MHLYDKRPRFRFRGLVVSVLVFAAVIALFSGLLTKTGETADAEQTKLLADAIRKAAVSCYAIEGQYPATLSQLAEDYGVVIDENRFLVRYDIFASNIMPDISVIFKGDNAT